MRQSRAGSTDGGGGRDGDWLKMRTVDRGLRCLRVKRKKRYRLKRNDNSIFLWVYPLLFALSIFLLLLYALLCLCCTAL